MAKLSALFKRLLWERDIFLTITAPILVSLLASVIAAFIFKGPALAAFIVTAFVFVVLFSVALGMLWQRSLIRLEQLFDSRLPPGEFDMQVERQDLAEEEVTSVVRNANRLILATGSRSRVVPYLQAIEHRVQQKVVYTRVLTGDTIASETCQHLCRILSDQTMKTHSWVYRHERTDLGYFTVTDFGFYAFFPSPTRHAPLENYLRVLSNNRIIEFFRLYVETLARTADELIAGPERIQNLCETGWDEHGRCPKCGEMKAPVRSHPSG